MCTFIFKYRQQTTSVAIYPSDDEILISCNTGASASISNTTPGALDVPDNLRDHLNDSNIYSLYLRQTIVSLLSGCEHNTAIVMLIEEIVKRMKKQTMTKFDINVDVGYKKIKSLCGKIIDLPTRLGVSSWDVGGAIDELTAK